MLRLRGKRRRGGLRDEARERVGGTGEMERAAGGEPETERGSAGEAPSPRGHSCNDEGEAILVMKIRPF